MRRFLWIFLALMPAPILADCAILLHGLARTDTSLLVMAEALEREGYQVENAAFDSTSDEIQILAETAIEPAIAACGAQPVHFVTHSMGGILLRSWVLAHPDLVVSNSVMLAPPNHGSEIVDKLGVFAPFEWLNGPSGMQLRTGTSGLPNQLGPVDFPLGVIAGDRSLNPIFSRMIPGRDDGKVSVSSTRVTGMRAHLTLPVTHTFIMNNPIVIAQTMAFLENGAFEVDLNYAEALRRLALAD